MTTENRNTDPTGAEENKPTDQNAANQQQGNAESPMEILEKRLAEIEAKSTADAQPEQEVPKEEQPEIKPTLTTDAEAAASEETTQIFVEANSTIPDSATTDEATAAAPAADAAEGSIPVTSANATIAPSSDDIVSESLAALVPEEGAGEGIGLGDVAAALSSEETGQEEAPIAVTPEEIATPVAAANAVPPTPSAKETPAAHDPHEEEEEVEEEIVDYSTLSVTELRQQLVTSLKGADARKRYKAIGELQRHYELKFQGEKAEALDRFKQEGGTDEDFEYHPPKEHQDLEQLISAYRDARHQERQQTEEQRQRNLERKRELLKNLRILVESAETKSSNDEMKKLQNEWKTIGPVPAGEAQVLWDSYHALLDIFYNNRSIFFELKELDRKRNLDAKQHLIERAETLVEEQSINKALQELRHLHEEWKNIGPVPNEHRDPIWDRFIKASEKVHERRRAYQDDRKVHETVNLTKKRELLDRLLTFQNFNTDRINEWRDKTDEIQKLKEEWDAAGLVPKEYAEEINKTFWSNYKAFFQHKNQFFKGLDEQKMQNLRLKTELCEEAESLKESTDWNSTNEKLIQLQKKWKTIGRVPDKHSDKIWQRFRTACNEFFDRKQVNEQQKGAEQEKLSSEKMDLCDHITEKLAQPTATTSMQEFEGFLSQWQALDQNGKRSNPKVEEKFLVLMGRVLERVPELSNEERNEILVRLQVDRLKGSPESAQKLQQREQSIRREISHLQNDIQTLRTNIEFFARSKNADKLREEYEGRITEAQKRIDVLQRQLNAFRG